MIPSQDILEDVPPVFCCSLMSDSLWPHGLWPARLLCPWDPPGKNTEVGFHFWLQGIFPTQGSNPRLLRLHSSPLVPPSPWKTSVTSNIWWPPAFWHWVNSESALYTASDARMFIFLTPSGVWRVSDQPQTGSDSALAPSKAFVPNSIHFFPKLTLNYLGNCQFTSLPGDDWGQNRIWINPPTSLHK